MLSRRDLLRDCVRLGAGVLGLGALGGLDGVAWARPRTGALAARLGAYGGSVDLPRAAALERRLGRRLRFVHDFLPTGEDWSRLYRQPWAFQDHWLRPGSPYGDRLYLSVPLLVAHDTVRVDAPGPPTTLARAAAGAYDAHYAALGRQLVALGLGRARVRIGWEMNIAPGPAAGEGGDWSAGCSRSGERDFALAFRRMVRAMRRASGQDFRFVWCPAIGSSWSPELGRPIDPARCYPGDAYVDVIACDVYDRSWSHNRTPEQRWLDIATDRYGNVASLAWFRRFTTPSFERPNNDGSRRVGRGHAAPGARKPLGLGEFGTYRADGERPHQRDGGDDPEFLRRLVAWMTDMGTGRWDHLNYWNFGSGELTARRRHRRWDAEVHRLFGRRRASSRRA